MTCYCCRKSDREVCLCGGRRAGDVLTASHIAGAARSRWCRRAYRLKGNGVTRQ